MSCPITDAQSQFEKPNFELVTDPLKVVEFAKAHLPTQWGDFQIIAFKNNRDYKDHVALVHGDVQGMEDVPTRIHSECMTGDVFGSLKCDCGEQLHRALQEIQEGESGILLYMRQEGRGIGLANKIKAYSLQDRGFDTVEANLHLGFDDDMRDYEIAAQMLQLLKPASVSLITNNPRKVSGLREHGVDVTTRQPLRIAPNPHNVDYLATKKAKSGHLL